MATPTYAKGATVTFPAVHAAGGSTYSYNVKAAEFVGAEVSAQGQCPTSTRDWNGYGQATFAGQLQANKQFYSTGQKVGTYAAGHTAIDQEASLPATALQLVCFDDPKTTPAQITAYAASVPAGRRVVFIFSQEYEHQSWASPAAFFTWFGSLSAAVRGTGNPDLLVCADSASSAYSTGGKAASGAWIVPADLVDVYGVDCYQNQGPGKWPAQGLANYDTFQNWLAHTATAGKQLAICEYGVNAASGDAARHDRIAEDAAYLLSAQTPPWLAWLYWYSDCTAAALSTTPLRQHQFHDPATIGLWTSICAGTF